MKLINIRTLLSGIFCAAIVSACTSGDSSTEKSNAELTSLTLKAAYEYSLQVTSHLSQHGEEETIEAVKAAVADSLKSPSSAQFHSVHLVEYGAGRVVCGHINGKNSDDVYMGFRAFVAGMSGFTITSTGGYESVRRAQNAGVLDACG